MEHNVFSLPLVTMVNEMTDLIFDNTVALFCADQVFEGFEERFIQLKIRVFWTNGQPRAQISVHVRYRPFGELNISMCSALDEATIANEQEKDSKCLV